MPGTDFMKRERRRSWLKLDNDGGVRGRNSASNSTMKDQAMTDLDVLDHRSIRPSTYRLNAVTGIQFISTVVGLTRFDTPVEPGLEVIADTLTRKVGYGRTGEHVFDFRMEHVGSPPPPAPEEEEFKPAVSWVWSTPAGLVEHITNGAIARGAVVEVWEKYKAASEAVRGMMPVIRIGEPLAVQSSGRTFYAPNFQIVGWVARDDVPAFRDRPVRCPLPSLTPERLTYTPVAQPQLAPPAKRPGRAPAPVHDTRDDINDAIPF
jgi:hypothetical protein